jgi:predicted permease
MLQDLRTAIRAIAKDRWFSAAAVVALALGIGVNATVFTLVNAVLLRGLPFHDSGNLYVVGTRRAADGPGRGSSVSYRELQDWKSQARTFVDLAGFSQNSMNISDDLQMPEQQRGARVTTNLFRLLGQQPLLGRDFGADDGRKDSELVVILGHTVWKTRYQSDPDVLGRPIRINGEPAVVVGVMPPGIKFPTNAEVWTQVVPDADSEKRNIRNLAVAGRVRPGVSREEALTELNAISAGLASRYPDTNKDIGVTIETFNERFNGGEIRTVFLALMGAVGFVLLIACANVANLQLSRAIRRAREVAVRVALGATRWRVVRQLLVESVLLGCLGGILGLVIAMVGVRLFDAAVADVGKPYWIAFTMDYTVFGFLAGICVLTGILFGIAPALQISKTNVNDLLKEGGRGNAGSTRARWLSGTMVVIELALTIVLLVGAGLMVRSFMALYNSDLGIPTEHLMTMRLSLPGPKYRTAETRMAFYDRLAPRLSSLAGADSVAIATDMPGFGAFQRRMEIEGRPAPAQWEERPQISTTTVSPAFFRTVGIDILRGRTFTETDGTPGSEVIIVNEKLASEYFADDDPIGRRIRFPVQPPVAGQPEPGWRTIIGISRTLPNGPRDDRTPPGFAYIPYRLDPPAGAALIVRSRLDPGAIMNAVRREVQAVDPDQPVFTVQTVEQMQAQATWPYRVFGSLFAIFALIALVLSAVGVYAVMAYSVTQRRQEIGVRMALGAGSPQVMWLVMKRGLLQLGVGLTLGLAGAFFLSRVLTTLLVAGVPPNDPVTFVAITVLLSAVALTACLVPARRATRVDPLTALRD